MPHVHCGQFFSWNGSPFLAPQDRRNVLSTAACLGWYRGPERHLFIPFWRLLLSSLWGYFLPKWLLSGNHMGQDGQVSNVTMQIAVLNQNQGLKCQTLNVPQIHVFLSYELATEINNNYAENTSPIFPILYPVPKLFHGVFVIKRCLSVAHLVLWSIEMKDGRAHIPQNHRMTESSLS